MFSKTVPSIVLISAILASSSATAAQLFTYRLIEGKNTIRYYDGDREIYGQASGVFQFQVGDGDIETTVFDLSIHGPFYDSLLNDVTDAPFQSGDKLSDLIEVDFSTTSGIAIRHEPLEPYTGPPLSQHAYIGPQVSGDTSKVVLGHNYYQIYSLGPVQSLFELSALAVEELGGKFTLFPPGEGVSPEPGEPVPFILRLIPNVQRVPEPSTLVLVFWAMVAARSAWRLCR